MGVWEITVHVEYDLTVLSLGQQQGTKAFKKTFFLIIEEEDEGIEDLGDVPVWVPPKKKDSGSKWKNIRPVGPLPEDLEV